jgi:hypothetical protein
MVHVRGLHETGGMQGFHVMRRKEDPGTATTKLARLDHQRGLLKRQLAVWTEKQQVTKHRLNLVEKQMAETERLVRQLAGPRRAAKGRKLMRAIAAGDQAAGAAAALPLHKEMNLEY